MCQMNLGMEANEMFTPKGYKKGRKETMASTPKFWCQQWCSEFYIPSYFCCYPSRTIIKIFFTKISNCQFGQYPCSQKWQNQVRIQQCPNEQTTYQNTNGQKNKLRPLTTHWDQVANQRVIGVLIGFIINCEYK
jgi:hypothetical protein